MKWLKSKEISDLEKEIKEGEIYLNKVREETLSLQKQYSDLNLDPSNPEILYRQMDKQWDSFIQYSFELNRREERLYDLKKERKINIFMASLSSSDIQFELTGPYTIFIAPTLRIPRKHLAHGKPVI